MTKNELATELCKRSELSKSQSLHAIEGLLDIIADTLARDEAVLLRGFGTFKTVCTAAHQGFDFHARKTIPVPAARRVKFIAYNDLKQQLAR